MSRQVIQVYEHSALQQGQRINGVEFTSAQLYALQAFHAGEGSRFYSLVHRGIRFHHYVGVIQVGGLHIEVLPKIDRQAGDAARWRDVLLRMLRYTGGLRVEAPTYAHLQTRGVGLLDIYIGLFLDEVQAILHRGLLKTYRQTEGNRHSLQGRLDFTQQTRRNLVHAERFYVHAATYDTQHPLNRILYKALLLLQRLPAAATQAGRVQRLLLDFPPMPDIAVDAALFERLHFDQERVLARNKHYEKAIHIARLLLLNHHPDLQSGRHDVLALLFDMNALWERHVLKQLQQAAPPEWEFQGQSHRDFWQIGDARPQTLRCDIVLRDKADGRALAVLDTKWKLQEGQNVGSEDLKQMFAYHHLYESGLSALIYPGAMPECTEGRFKVQGRDCKGLIWRWAAVDPLGRLDLGLGARMVGMLRDLLT